MATPGLEQAVLLVLDIEPLFIFISFFFVVRRLHCAGLQTDFLSLFLFFFYTEAHVVKSN